MWLIDSSIGRKLIMSITGAMLVLFLLFHSIMNFVAIINPYAYDAICAFLGANWYALIATLVLAFLTVVHVLYAFWLTLQNKIARGRDAYSVNKRPKGVEWASENMLVLGLIILGFLALHLYNFWYKMQLTELLGKINGEEISVAGAALVQGLFQSPVYCLLYMVWLTALWFHLTHGVWSALQSIGWSNDIWLPRIKVISNVVSTIVVGLFMLVPIYYLIVNFIL